MLAQAPPAPPRHFVILVVDDQPGEILVMNQWLSTEYQVLRALSGEQALSIAGSQDCDLILMDLNMPGMSGHETFLALQSDARTRSIPVIFTTATDHPDEETRCLALGAQDFISKPINPSVLVARVRTQLRLKEANDELRRNAQRLHLWASVFAFTREAVVITDPLWRIVETNAAFGVITGFKSSEVRGHDLHELLRLEQRQSKARILSAIAAAGFWSAEINGVDKDGNVFPKLATISVVRDESGTITHLINVFTDISLLKSQQRRLEHLAHYDPLTGVPNRNLLAERLEQAVQRAQASGRSFAVIYIDLDGFKEINDRHGHAVGDLVLQEQARRISQRLREGDTLARMGGDEFVIIMDTSNGPYSISGSMERIGILISEPMVLAGVQVHVAASMGVTFFPQDKVEPEQLLRHADQAMYEAKRAGKSTYRIFNAEAEGLNAERLSLAGRFSQALDQDELVLHYQPKVELGSGAVLGVEALLRWQHPELGLLGPDRFLPAVQGTPAGARLGRMVIESALRQLGQWREQGLRLSVSVNIDAQHLLDRTFLPMIERVISAAPWLERGGLLLELLESSAVEDPKAASRVIGQCANLGVEFALDDFGRAYSTLDLLRYLPAQELKIDRSFVQDLGHDQEAEAIVHGIVELARSFGCRVVGEGIETVEQGLALLRLGCGSGQGYLIARPMPAPELEPWLRAWQPPAQWRAGAS